MFKQPAWTRIIPPANILALARLGPLGRLPAPGTWGSAAGALFFAACFRGFHPPWTSLSIFESLLVCAVTGYFAVGICGAAETILAKRDPGEINLDEFVAMPLCFLGWQWIVGPGFLAFLGLLLAGFLLFRFYDIRKPLVINTLQELPGGWGIVIDDTAAALATCATLHLAHALWRLV
jgi:phosphatidylglycerophosphatase A